MYNYQTERSQLFMSSLADRVFFPKNSVRASKIKNLINRLNRHHNHIEWADLIILDTNVIGQMFGVYVKESLSDELKNYLLENIDKIRITREIDEELRSQSKNNDLDKQDSYKKISGNLICEINTIDYDEVKRMQLQAKTDPALSDEWKRNKKMAIKNEFGTTEEEIKTIHHEEIMEYLYKKAKLDRKIIAKAMYLASQHKVLLISNDGDMITFSERIKNYTDNLIICRPANICLDS